MSYHTEDITWCMNKYCTVTKCERNPKHIKQMKSHSFAYLEGTDYCEKSKSDKSESEEL